MANWVGEVVAELLAEFSKDAKNFSVERRDNVKNSIEHFKSRVESEDYTVQYSEYVGIGSYDDSCIFEIEVETELDSKPEVCSRLAFNLTFKLTRSVS